MGSVYVITFFTVLILIVSGTFEIITRCFDWLCPVTCGGTRLHRINDTIKEKLLWNFVIRLILEGALDIAFAAYINLVYGEFNIHLFGSWVNYVSAYILGGAVILLPVWILWFYLRNYEHLENEEFAEKYGAVYEGLKPN
jgi:hypothetical protein